MAGIVTKVAIQQVVPPAAPFGENSNHSRLLALVSFESVSRFLGTFPPPFRRPEVPMRSLSNAANCKSSTRSRMLDHISAALAKDCGAIGNDNSAADRLDQLPHIRPRTRHALDPPVASLGDLREGGLVRGH